MPYEPKLDPKAVVAGYLRVDPGPAAQVAGYLNLAQEVANQAQQNNVKSFGGR